MYSKMNITRRNLAALVPALATVARAQEATLPSKTYRFEDLPVRQNGPNASRAILRGLTHSGFPIEMHETELGAGLAPHPPHHHVHEEIVIVLEGTLDVTVNAATSKLGPGSVVYFASNDEHGFRNAGDSRARYCVMALGRDN
jgi:quercetin dioxygenase-like cupin family protein